MNNWQEQIPGCFGVADRIMCSHESEQERTLIMLQSAKKDRAKLSEIEYKIKEFLLTSKARPEHIQTQLERFREFLWENSKV